MEQLFYKLLELLIEAVLISGILGYFFLKREERLKRTIEEEFKKRDTFFKAKVDYKRRSLEELLGPIMMQLKRSSIALDTYKPNDAYREAILKQCNETIRNLLLTKSYLIPTDLLSKAADFLKHYDGWLQHYHQIREIENNKEKPFVFTHDFPHEAEEKFLSKYEEYRKVIKIDEKLK